MQVYGIDFTSRPTKRKPITCAVLRSSGDHLIYQELHRLPSFSHFERSLQTPGPWVAGMDFPFGQSARFIENIGWPNTWERYVRYVSTLSRVEFRESLDNYRAPRPKGDKEHRRFSDRKTGAISPQKLYGVPVGLMFFAGAKRLLASGATIAGLKDGDPARVVFESYPGVLARKATRSGYKNDDPKKQTTAQQKARSRILEFINSSEMRSHYGLDVTLSRPIEDDPTGDTLDALICAVQAAWAWRNWPMLEQQLNASHRLEGWIADPAVFQ